MSEQGEPDPKPTEPAKGDLPIQAPQVVRGIDNAKPATEQQLTDVKREMNAFERSTLYWTRATFGILAVTGLFISLQWCEMRSGSEDTQKLVVAAKKQAAANVQQVGAVAALAMAAGKQADAASRFAESAASINTGVGNAVAKLNLQAGELEASVKQTARLADATEKANANVINSDRPWMGASFAVDGFGADKSRRLQSSS